MRVLICGGGDYGRVRSGPGGQAGTSSIEQATQARQQLTTVLDTLHAKAPFSVVICGREGGAERLGKAWAERRGIEVLFFDRLNPREDVGSRNSRMVRNGNPDIVVSFGGGANTAKLIEEARQLKIEVLSYPDPAEQPDQASALPSADQDLQKSTFFKF